MFFFFGLTKSVRKKYHTEMDQKNSNMNLSYNVNLSIKGIRLKNLV